MSRFNPGDRVVVRPAHRGKFHDDSPAARGEVMTVHECPGGVIPTALSFGQVQIGPKPCDHAYEHELEAAP
jgi:hypothetical protein